MKLLATLATVLIWAGGFLIGYTAGQPHKPNCPTEDSCVASYDNGEWHITEVTP